ncbi:hypothetical protein H8959_017408 [Pygathrix nigripes]
MEIELGFKLSWYCSYKQIRALIAIAVKKVCFQRYCEDYLLEEYNRDSELALEPDKINETFKR